MLSPSTRTLSRRLRTLIVAFYFAESALFARAAAEPAELRVMSFNIRFSQPDWSEEASENNWADAKYPRRERVIRVIRENRPDLLGVQEARELQVNDLRAALPEYSFYGIGRDDGKLAGEFSGIFYRKQRFTLHDAGSFWLSDSPEKPGTSFYHAVDACPRIASWVRLADVKSNRQFVFLNMHWDHIDEEARQKSAALVRERLSKLARDLPAIVMGDLNSFEDTPAVNKLIGDSHAEGELADSFRELHRERSPNEASFDDWKGTIEGSRIDFILHTREFSPLAAEIVRTSYNGHWPSDHYPVTAVLRYQPTR